jgi:hypothetical protein
MVTHKKDVTSGDVTSGNDKLIHVPVPSFAKLATFIYGFFYSQIHHSNTEYPKLVKTSYALPSN